MLMKLYHKFDIDNLDIIQSKIKSYLKDNNFIDTDANGFIPLNLDDIKDACPELLQHLSSMNFNVISVAIYKTTSTMPAPPIHVDAAPYLSRINIPIMNCETSSTVFYKADILETKTQHTGPKVQYVECINAVEIDRVTIDKPTILVIRQPHQVIMDLTKSPRICLTIRVDPDPILSYNSRHHNIA